MPTLCKHQCVRSATAEMAILSPAPYPSAVEPAGVAGTWRRRRVNCPRNSGSDSLIDRLEELDAEFGLDVPEAAELWDRIERRHAELFPDGSLADTYEIRSRAHNKPLS